MFRVDELSFHLGEDDRKPPGDGNTEGPGGSTSRIKDLQLCSCGPAPTEECEGPGKGDDKKGQEAHGLLLRQLRRELGEARP
ncbi:MAG: hypothetical protein ABUT39_28385 [Acidobacteriota bacterium]